MATILPLKAMVKGTPWYTEDPTSGDAIITRALWNVRGNEGIMELSDAARMALALTSACCKLGVGKRTKIHEVFYLHPDRMLPHGSQRGLSDAYAAFKAVPSLFYIPTAWTKDGKAEWESMMPLKQVEALTSRYGMVPQYMSVLPLDVELLPSAGPGPILNGLKTGAATILLSPVTYIGPTNAMRLACGSIDMKTLQYRPSAGWKSFRQWRQAGGLVGAVKVLNQMYRNQEDGLLFLGSLQQRLIEANRIAGAGGEAYYLPDQGTKDEDEDADEDADEDEDEDVIWG